ncbi:hydrolase [Devosia yakushimensis]|uniref:Hydrolase n=1 Tax=Devosia yakushimensis TaxID=470028 RepID=A0ABQ5UEB0_9HYPH|nr:amidohydrolase family protein [Devosia yakushimensis]GLQ10429.1 hydrolase [Devosia yakushimensis]
MSDAPLCLPPKPLGALPRLPVGACDSHFHVFEAGAPLASPRSYTPQILTIADWQPYAEAAGIARGVLVQPSVYGLDNGVMLRAIARDPGRLRGVAVVAPDISAGALRELDAGGVRGIRINTRNKAGVALEAVAELLGKVGPLGWSVQFQVRAEQLADVAALEHGEVPLVLDHLAFIRFGEADTGERLDALRRLLDRPNICTKISAPYRLTARADYADVGAAITALTASHPHRLLWGSDWPHTELWDGMPDDGDLLSAYEHWLPDPQLRQQIFVDTPNSLFFSR